MTCDDNNISSKRCLDCQTEISRTAKKCLECGSYQDWRRFTGFGSIFLSLAVALLSVSGVVVPLLIESLSDKAMKIDGYISWVDETKISIIAINSGDKIGLIRTVGVRGGANQIEIIGYEPQLIRQGEFVKKVIELEVEHIEALFNSESCGFIYEITNQEKFDKQQEIQMPCSRL